MRAVAGELDLPEDWLSDAAKGFADILPPDFYHRLVPLEFTFQRLRLYALGKAVQAAMKIVALREQDLEDLELLLPQLSEAEQKVLVAIIDHVSAFRPDWGRRKSATFYRSRDGKSNRAFVSRMASPGRRSIVSPTCRCGNQRR